jgi:hypothetical protein
MTEVNKGELDFVLKDYQTIDLEQIETVKLMNRVDRKYTLQLATAFSILQKAQGDYFILEVNNIKISPYISEYFDTEDYSLYFDHHSKKVNRYKIRHRFYGSSNESFVEVKFKNNKGRTIKTRMKDFGNNPEVFSEEQNQFINNLTGINTANIAKVLGVKYNRVTLVNQKFTERVTFDFELKFNDNQHSVDYGAVVVIEVKQSRFQFSPIVNLLKAAKIPALGLSKYCLGMISLKPNIKHNSFRKKLHLLRKYTNKSINI